MGEITPLLEWRALVFGREDPSNPLTVSMPLQQSKAGGSGCFLARLSNNERWWVKPTNNGQGPKVVVTEHIVAKAGELIEAPVCKVDVVWIPEELVGWEFRPGHKLQQGFAHARMHVEDALESRQIAHWERDDNAYRYVGIAALYDWCWGGDPQWLHSQSQDRKVYSHDHGWYLPEVGPSWDAAALLKRLNEPHPLPGLPNRLDPKAAEVFADRLAQVTRSDLAAILRTVPSSWDVTDEELATVGYFLEVRAQAVSARLRVMAGGNL